MALRRKHIATCTLYTRTHTHANTHAQKRSHTHTQTHPHMHMQTHTNKHTQHTCIISYHLRLAKASGSASIIIHTHTTHTPSAYALYHTIWSSQKPAAVRSLTPCTLQAHMHYIIPFGARKSQRQCVRYSRRHEAPQAADTPAAPLRTFLPVIACAI